MIERRRFAGPCTVRILCVIALLFVGFAHRPPAASAGAIPPGESALYTLPDGTLPTLCLASEDGRGLHSGARAGGHDVGHSGGPDGIGMARDCYACRLTAGFLLPVPGDTLGQPIVWRAVEPVAPLSLAPLPRRSVEPNASPRGPPSAVPA